jgi:hypothetical protein
VRRDASRPRKPARAARGPSFDTPRQQADQLRTCIDRDHAKIARPDPLKSGARKRRLEKYVRLDRPPGKIAPWSRIGREIRKRHPADFELSVPEAERDGFATAFEHRPRGGRISASVFSRSGN